MDTSTLVPPGGTPAAHTAADTSSRSPEPPSDRHRSVRTGLAAEVRESLMLLGFATAVTVGLTTAAQAALVLLS